MESWNLPSVSSFLYLSDLWDKMLADLTVFFFSFLGASLKQATGIGKRLEFDAIKEYWYGV